MRPATLVVLVLEGNPEQRGRYLSHLERAGFVARAASSVAEACECAAQIRIDALLVDYDSVREAAETVVTDICKTARPRLCLLLTRPDVALAGTNFDMVLKKPIDLDTVVETIATRAWP